MAKKNKKKRRIRPLALCVFIRGDKIFLAQGYDSHERRVFYRPIGGRIEFGERGCQAVVRELREEIDAEVAVLKYLGVLENIFEYEGLAGHEIALVYQGRFLDQRFADDEVRVRGHHKGEVLYEAAWMPLDLFRGEISPALYPAGLLELLDTVGSA